MAAPQIRRNVRPHGGFTLIELTIVIALIGVLSVAIGSGIITLLRNAPVVNRVIAESHDQQQLTDYFVGDARSTTASNLDYSTTAVGCPGAIDGMNLIQFTFQTQDSATWRRINYRLIPGTTNSTIDRINCGGTSATTMTAGTTSRTNIADSLAPAPANWTNLMAPAVLTPPGATGSGSQNLISIALTRSRGTINVTASLAQFSSQPVPASTTPTTNVAAATTSSSTTTTTTAPAATTSTAAATTTTVAASPAAACALLGTVLNVLASITPPSAATTLLDNSVTGALIQPYTVTGTISLAVSAGLLGLLSLNATVCASVQIAYNTGNTAVVVPATTTATCTAYVVVCVSATLTLSITLQASAAQPWTVGAHAVSFVNSGGTALANGTGSVTVATDPTTIPTTTTTIPVTTPTVPQGASLNPIVAAQGFSILTEGNVNLTGVSVASGVAAGGDVSWHSYGTVAATATPNFKVSSEGAATSLVAGGKFDLSSSDASLTVSHGFIHAGSMPALGWETAYDGSKLVVNNAILSQYWMTPRAVVDGDSQTLAAAPFVRAGIFPFATAFTSLRQSALRIAALNPTSTCTSVTYPQVAQSNGQWVLNLVPGQVNVLNLTSATYNSLSNVNGTGTADATTYIVVNILDYNTVTLTTKYWNQFQNGRHASILFNFPNASAVNVSGAFYGTLFAPNAAVTASGIQLDGDVVAKNFTTTSGSTITVARFDAAIPCIG